MYISNQFVAKQCFLLLCNPMKLDPGVTSNTPTDFWYSKPIPCYLLTVKPMKRSGPNFIELLKQKYLLKPKEYLLSKTRLQAKTPLICYAK